MNEMLGEIRMRVAATPFKPFTVKLRGLSTRIVTPDQVALVPFAERVHIFPVEGVEIIANKEQILEITEQDPLESKPDRRRKSRGQPCYAFYKIVRLHADVLLETPPTMLRWSARGRARALELKPSTYKRVEQFVREHRTLIVEARGSGDWTRIEQILFAHHGLYRVLPGFERTRREIEAEEALRSRRQQRGNSS